MLLRSRPAILPGVTHPAAVPAAPAPSEMACPSHRARAARGAPPWARRTETLPPALRGPARPCRPPRGAPPPRRGRVPAGLRTLKLIAPPGSGERRGLGGGSRGALGPAPSGRLLRGGCAPRAGCAPASGPPGAGASPFSSRFL